MYGKYLKQYKFLSGSLKSYYKEKWIRKLKENAELRKQKRDLILYNNSHQNAYTVLANRLNNECNVVEFSRHTHAKKLIISC